MAEGVCQTCKKRKYQDGSDDPGVSFKTPTNVAPELAASAVRGHEQEHVVREQAEARREGREVVSQSVSHNRCLLRPKSFLRRKGRADFLLAVGPAARTARPEPPRSMPGG